MTTHSRWYSYRVTWLVVGASCLMMLAFWALVELGLRLQQTAHADVQTPGFVLAKDARQAPLPASEPGQAADDITGGVALCGSLVSSPFSDARCDSGQHIAAVVLEPASAAHHISLAHAHALATLQLLEHGGGWGGGVTEEAASAVAACSLVGEVTGASSCARLRERLVAEHQRLQKLLGARDPVATFNYGFIAFMLAQSADPMSAEVPADVGLKWIRISAQAGHWPARQFLMSIGAQP